MKFSLLLLTAIFGLMSQAQALEIDVKARIPVDCTKERQIRPVSILSAYSLDSEENTIGFSVQYGECRGRAFQHHDTAADFNFYLIDMGYTPDLRSSYELKGTRGNNLIVGKMSADPRSLFAQGNNHHFVASFYPYGNSEAFVWDLTFTQDPTTGKIRLVVEPRN